MNGAFSKRNNTHWHYYTNTYTTFDMTTEYMYKLPLYWWTNGKTYVRKMYNKENPPNVKPNRKGIY